MSMVERMPPDSTDTIYPIKRYSDQAAKKLSNFIVPKRHTGKERLKRSRANNNLYPVPRGKMILNTVRLQGRYRNTLSLRACMLILVVFAATTVVEAEGLDEPAEFDIPAQGLDSALLAFSEQGKIQVVVSTDAVSGRETEGVEGEHTPREALEHLLANAGLTYSAVGLETVAVSTAEDEPPGKAQAAPSAILMVQASTNDKIDPAEESIDSPTDEAADRRSHTLEFDASTGRFEITDEIIVRGSRRNLAIRRSEDDFQPFVVIDKDEIQRSGIADLDDFLRARLTSNVSPASSATSFSAANQSTVNLRGLGLDETLILVNGRRLPRVVRDGSFQQGDLNGIPLSIVERIEVLPATVAGIYGGGATGGAVNIILRSDYRGLELGFNYDNTFDTDSAVKEFTATGGFSLEDGKIDILFSTAYQDSNELLNGDRPFFQEARGQALANDPDQIINGRFPPTGATTNVFGISGPLVLDDGTPLNSDRTSVPYGYAGAASDGGAALLGNAGNYNLDFPNDYGRDGLRRSLLNDPTVYSLSLNVNREFTPWLNVYFDSLYRVNEGNFRTNDNAAGRIVLVPGDAPNNPFDNFVLVNVPLIGLDASTRTDSESLQLAIGFVADLPENWALSGDISWSQTDSETVSGRPLTTSNFNDAYTSGTVDVFSDFNSFTPDYSGFFREQPGRISSGSGELLNFSLRGSGPLFELPGGSVNGSFLIEQFNEEVDTGIVSAANAAGTGDRAQTATSPASQRVRSVFGEILFPFVSKKNTRPGLQTLEATISARYDSYENEVVPDFIQGFQAFDIGASIPSFNLSSIEFSGQGLTFGLRYAPIDDVTFRASFASGIKPPTLRELQPFLLEDTFFFLSDPQRGGTSSLIGPVDVVRRGNPELEPEDSETISVGAIVVPRSVEGLRVSIDYVRIEKEGEVTTVRDQFLLDNEALFTDRIVRGPLEPDAPSDFTAGPIELFNATSLNRSRTKVESIDFQLRYGFRSEHAGQFDLNIVGTHNLGFETQDTPDADVIDSVDLFAGPIEWLGNARIDWEKGSWRAGWVTQYVGSYSVLNSTELASETLGGAKLAIVGRDRIPSQFFHDAYVGYRSDLLGADLSFTVRNISNQYEIVPFAVTGVGFAPPLDPRLRSYVFSLKKSF